MGYTNHWYRVLVFDGRNYQAAIEDLRKVLPATGVDLAGHDGEGKPAIRDNYLCFNGRFPARCEAFYMPRILYEFGNPGRLPGFAFAKTEHLPYDLAVKVSLLVFKLHLGSDLEIGSNDEDLLVGWRGAIELVDRVLGRCGKWRVAEGDDDGLRYRHLVPA